MAVWRLALQASPYVSLCALCGSFSDFEVLFPLKRDFFLPNIFKYFAIAKFFNA